MNDQKQIAPDAAAPKHTAGPWVFYADTPGTEPNWHIVTNASRMRVVANVHIEPGNQVDIANARLIAAAPDLLASLKALLNGDPNDDRETLDRAINAAQAAIAKAEGR